jgi:hypothetical protein
MVAVTFFSNHAATTKREEQLTLAALAGRIESTSRPTKASLPWLKLATFGDRRTEEGSLRHNANVVAITGIEGDYDGTRMSFETAEAKLTEGGINAILYTSPSFTEDEPKWRVLCPFATEHPPIERDHFMARLNGLFGGIFSRESWVISQSYYFGSVKRNPSHRVAVIDGTCIDEANHLDEGAIAKPEKRRPNGANGQHHPAARPEDITDARIRGLVASLLRNVSNAPDGSKHHILFDIGRIVGGYLHLTNWSADEAAAQLVAAPPASVEDWDEARKTAADAVAIGMEQPLELEDRPNPRESRQKRRQPGNGRDPGANGDSQPDRNDQSGEEAGTGDVSPPDDWDERQPPPRAEDDDFVLPVAFSENALAHQFTVQHTATLIYCHGWGKWLRWETGQWREDHTVSVYGAARDLCARMGELAIASERSGRKIAAIINKATCITAIERLARHDHRHERHSDGFDADPWLLNGPTGCLLMRKD